MFGRATITLGPHSRLTSAGRVVWSYLKAICESTSLCAGDNLFRTSGPRTPLPCSGAAAQTGCPAGSLLWQVHYLIPPMFIFIIAGAVSM